MDMGDWLVLVLFAGHPAWLRLVVSIESKVRPSLRLNSCDGDIVQGWR